MTWWKPILSWAFLNRRARIAGGRPVTAPAASGRGSPGERLDDAAQTAPPEQKINDGGDEQDRSEHPDSGVVAAERHTEAGKRHRSGHAAVDDRNPVEPALLKPIDEDRILGDQSLVLAHGARSLFVTGLIAVMVFVSIAAAPDADLAWRHAPIAWAGGATLGFAWSRLVACGGIVPPGTHGDSRFIIAAIAAFCFLAASPETSLLLPGPFFLLLLAAGLAGLSDGAWTATAMRRMKLTFPQTLLAFLRTALKRDASTWRIAAPSSPGDAP